MSMLRHLKKEEQEIMPLFNGAFIENKPIPFPQMGKTQAYSNLFYWAHLEAKATSEFPLHPHEGFEIMTFVFEGSLEHYDTASKLWTPLKSGDVQVIQAGSGVQHAERILKGTRLFQIWFDPDFSLSLHKAAQYKDYAGKLFKSQELGGIETCFYIGGNSPIVSITEGIEVYKQRMHQGLYTKSLDSTYTYSYYLLEGRMWVNGIKLEKDDFLVMDDTQKLEYKLEEDSEVFVIKSLTRVGYERFIRRYD